MTARRVDLGEFVQRQRERRYKLQSIAGELLPGERVATCARFMVPGSDTVNVFYSDALDTAHYGNLATCGSVWTCPVCAAKINARRRDELRLAIEHANGMGLHTFMVTFTLQHNRDDSLTNLLNALNDAYRRVKMGSPWTRKKERLGIVGYVAGLEVLHGSNGWHPHKHVVMFCERQLSEYERAEFEAWLSERYRRFLEKHDAHASAAHAVDVRGKRDAVSYITKWGLDSELTGNELKKSGVGHGLSPFKLLSAYDDGDAVAGRLFCEYAAAMSGVHQLQWSRGLRDFLGLVEDAATDDEVLERQEHGADVRIVVGLDWGQWKTVLRSGARGELLNAVQLLRGDRDAVWVYLEAIGVTRNAHERERAQAVRATGALSDAMLFRQAEAMLLGGQYEEVT